MQKVKLPLTVDPVKDAQQRIDYDGYYTASQLVRLAESTGKVLSDAQVTLSFYIDPQKLVVMKGQVQVDVELECQRCGEPFKQTLECHFMYSPVANWDQADDLPEIYEPIEFNEFGEIDLLGAVEDRLSQCIHLNTVKCPRTNRFLANCLKNWQKNRTRSLY